MLRCGATGIPQPNVIWKKIDGRTTVPVGPWEGIIQFFKLKRPTLRSFSNFSLQISLLLVSSICGKSLNLTHVNRIHMGVYECIADNGIPPQANQTFLLEVHCKFQLKHIFSSLRLFMCLSFSFLKKRKK